VPRKPEPHVENRIIEAALELIRQHGLGRLRVADVARAANTTVAMVYRRFVDRDGLIDATVAHFYEIRIEAGIARAKELLERPDGIRLVDIVDALPLPNYEGAQQIHELMSRVPGLAVENSTFAIRIRRFLNEVTPTFEKLIDQVVERLPCDERFDPRIITVFVMNQIWIFNNLRGAHRISNDEYREFVLQLMTDSQYRD
jgi:AcrR family transcriptional regulator